jgi:hypothetical protein
VARSSISEKTARSFPEPKEMQILATTISLAHMVNVDSTKSDKISS